MSKVFNIFVINPGSTSTKVALFKNEEEVHSKNIIHSAEKLKSFSRMFDQLEYRLADIMEFIKEKNISLKDLHLVMARGGLMKPVRAGTYEVCPEMIGDLRDGCMERWGFEHASNLAASMGKKIAEEAGVKAFIADPVTVDELSPLARISGVPGIEYKSTLHALNLRAVGRIIAEKLNKSFDELNLIGIHMGGGISVAAFEKGKTIEVTRGALGYGPFSSQRAGTLAIADVMDLCFSGDYTKKELMKKFMKNSGLAGYLGTDDGIEIEKRIKEGDEKAKLIYEAMTYQISKSTGAMATVLKGKIDGIYLTGGLANSKMIAELIKERVSFLGKFFVYPSQNEMYALASAGLRVLRGEEKLLSY